MKLSKNQEKTVKAIQDNILLSTGGEMKTWALRGSILGAIFGVSFGLLLTLIVIFSGVEFEALGHASYGEKILVLAAGPIVGLLFGAFGGTLIGVGTPKFNPNPQQGRWNTWLNRRKINYRS